LRSIFRVVVELFFSLNGKPDLKSAIWTESNLSSVTSEQVDTRKEKEKWLSARNTPYAWYSAFPDSLWSLILFNPVNIPIRKIHSGQERVQHFAFA
jgi:hypothetical protein